MKKRSKILFLLLSLAVLVLVASFFIESPFFRRVNIIVRNINYFQKDYSIISEDKDDKTGRTVFYDMKALNDNQKLYAGMGLKTSYVSKNETWVIKGIVGKFVRFENISGSRNDKYLIVNVPEISEYKVRVGGFYKSVNDPSYIIDTRFDVQDLEKTFSRQEKEEIEWVGYLSSLKDNQLSTLLKPGDAILVSTAVDLRGGRNILDDKGNLIAYIVTIRRLGGKSQIEKEIPLPSADISN